MKTHEWSWVALATLLVAVGCEDGGPAGVPSAPPAPALDVTATPSDGVPTCDGRVATIWVGMDPALLPKGASLVVREDEHEAGTLSEETTDDGCGCDEEEDPATIIVGTQGPDVIVGSSRPDLIQGENGDDVICGLQASDRILGGRGRDRIHGGPGADRIWGENGDDIAYGGAGADRIWGGPGDDGLDGGRGRDSLFGESGDDTLLGGASPDELDGGPGENLLDPGPEVCEEDDGGEGCGGGGGCGEAEGDSG